MRQLSIKNGNRILCVSTVVMIAVQFLLAFIGIYDTLTMLLVSQVSLILISFLLRALMSTARKRMTFMQAVI